MVNLNFDPLNAEEVRAAHAVTTGLMALYESAVKPAMVAEVKEDPMIKTAEATSRPAKVAPAQVVEETATAKANADTPEVDAREMPWDKRIHASTKTFLANGNWKNKRGVDPERLVEVEHELMGTVPAQVLEEEAADEYVPPDTIEVTIEDVREVLAVKANENREAIGAKLKSLGVKSVTFMDPKHYSEFKTFLEGLD